MTRTPEQILCCPQGCEKDTPDGEGICTSFAYQSVVTRLHAAGYMIVPREATTEMVKAVLDRDASDESMIYGQIYRAMTAEGELR